MYTLLISAAISATIALAIAHFTGMIILPVILALVLMIGINLLIGRSFSKKLTALMKLVEKDLKADRTDLAIEKIKSAYPYAKWQFTLQSTLDAYVGSILYVKKRFDEALPYLQKAGFRNWDALTMLASYYYKNKMYDKAFSTMDKAIKGAKKESFVYSLAAYFLSEQGQVDKALTILSKGAGVLPLDKKIEGNIEALKNKKKIKMQAYGPLWMQLHLAKAVDGGKPYQTLLANQKIQRR